MNPIDLLADISRRFFKKHNVFNYRMKKIAALSDQEVISCCHCYCEEYGLTEEWKDFRAETVAQYVYCSYLQEYIDEGVCYDLQMIAGGLIKPTALPDITIDREACMNHCTECQYSL